MSGGRWENSNSQSSWLDVHMSLGASSQSDQPSQSDLQMGLGHGLPESGPPIGKKQAGHSGGTGSQGLPSHTIPQSTSTNITTNPPETARESKDFVKKLFTMLEDPTHNHIVRWSESGDSFVVLDASEFTKEVLPLHFKHSNFASFVRQLNKYDFHKIRANVSKAGQTGVNNYPDNAWEFHHPDFNPKNKDQLDKIKRKVPGSSKKNPPMTSSSGGVTTSSSLANPDNQNGHISQSIDVDQLNHLSGELENVRKLNGFLAARVEQLEEDSRTMSKNLSMIHDAFLVQTTYFQRTLTLLSMSDSNGQFSALLESLSKDGSYSGMMPPPNLPSISNPTQQRQPQQPLQHSSIPTTTATSSTSNPTTLPTSRIHQMNENNQFHVLLADEDDNSVLICRRMLIQYGCDVDVANDGLEAVQRAESAQYDLILMDTILPQLDGMSATELIRNFDTNTPIIAMISSPGGDPQTLDSRTVENYRNKGVTMILPKPFSKSVLYNTLSIFLKPTSDPNPVRTVNSPSDPLSYMNSPTTSTTRLRDAKPDEIGSQIKKQRY